MTPMMMPISPDGVPLICAELPKVNTITVENGTYWRELYILSPSGEVQPLPYPEDPEFVGPEEEAVATIQNVRRIPNPSVVMRYAAAKLLKIDEVALEVMIGRWERKIWGHYSSSKEEHAQRTAGQSS